MNQEPERGVTEPALSTQFESEVRSYSRRFPAIFQRAQGPYLYARDGQRYLDFLTGCSALNYGHNPQPLKRALLDYIENDGLVHSLDMHSTAKEAFLDEFNRTILEPRRLDYVVQFPGPTGTNAVEAALKLARKVTGRSNVIAFTNGFHGVTLGALACTGNQHHRGGAGLPLQGVTRLPYDQYFGPSADTAAQLAAMLDDPSSGVDQPAAIIVESVQGEGGLNVASDAWLRSVAAIARKHGALFILDDIQAGVGRTGTFFSMEPAQIQPDIITLAKSVSGYGLPMSLVLIDRRYDRWAPGEHNGTFRGNCPAFVTARAALEHYWRDASFEAGIRNKARLLEQRLATIVKRYRALRLRHKGRGMMQGIELPSAKVADAIVHEAFARGLVIETSGPRDEVVKCLAPLTIPDSELNEGLDFLEAAVNRVLPRVERVAA